MYEKNDKRQLYWLIDRYLDKDITDRTFCDEFYYCYDLELGREALLDDEKNAFSELSQVSSRFSEYKSDHNLDSNAFSTSKELREKVIEVKKKINSYWPR